MKSASERATRSAPAAVNEVRLIGRLAAIGEVKTLPSGDVLRPFRLVVDRPPGRSAGSTQRVDTIDCHAVSAAPRRSLDRLDPGVVVEVQGALRRRFFRGAGGLASRYEVEAAAVRKVRAG